MLETFVVVLDISLLIVAALGAITASSAETRNEKGWWLVVFGLFILGLGHVTETLFGEVFHISYELNEVQHRLWVLGGFVIIVSGISFIRRSRTAEETNKEAKKESAKENKISSGKAELSSVGRQFIKLINAFSNFTF